MKYEIYINDRLVGYHEHCPIDEMLAIAHLIAPCTLKEVTEDGTIENIIHVTPPTDENE